MSEFDLRSLRRAFGSYMTGVTVVTTQTADGIHLGFTANSFTSVSLEPPLILVCPAKTLSSYDIFTHCNYFAVNILSEDQQEIAHRFSRPGDDRFAGLDWTVDNGGSAVFADSAAFFSCRTHQRVEAGDHSVLIGEVEHFDVSDTPGLGYSNGGFFSLGLERQAAELLQQSRSVNIGAIIEYDGAVLLESTPDGWRLPQIVAATHKNSLEQLRQGLAQQGINVRFGPVYSIFQDRQTAKYLTFYRATAKNAAPHEVGEYVAVDKIGALKYTSKALSVMMNRYALERQNGVFRLYVGDESGGDVHPVAED